MSDVEMTGPAVRVMLISEQRETFDAEFEQMLAYVSSSLDPEPLAALIRRWWVTGGGDPEVAEADRISHEKLRNLSKFLAAEETTKVCFPMIGPLVFERLPDDLKAQFEGDWEINIEAAANTFDVRHLQRLINNYWGIAVIEANPEAAADVSRRAEAAHAEELAAIAAERNRVPL